MWHLRAQQPANVTLLQADWVIKSQKGNWNDKIFPIMVPQWFSTFQSRTNLITLSGFMSCYDYLQLVWFLRCSTSNQIMFYIKKSCSQPQFCHVSCPETLFTDLQVRRFAAVQQRTALIFDEKHTHTRETLSCLSLHGISFLRLSSSVS